MIHHITGRNMVVGDALTEYVRDHLHQIERKYFGEMVASNIIFRKARRGIRFTCTITLTCNQGLVLHSSASKTSVYNAFNQAHYIVAQRVRKFKNEIVDDKPINLRKRNIFAEHFRYVGWSDEVEIIDIPALYGHVKE